MSVQCSMFRQEMNCTFLNLILPKQHICLQLNWFLPTWGGGRRDEKFIFLNITFNPKNILEFSGKYKCRPQGWAEPKQWAFPRFGILEIQKYTFFLTHNLSKPFSLKIFLKIALNYHVMVWWEYTGIPTKDETSEQL